MNNYKENPEFDITQFKKIVPKINGDMLKNLAQEARNQGISEEDIKAGMEFILNLKK